MFKSGFQIQILAGYGSGRIVPLSGIEINLGRAMTANEEIAGAILFHEPTVSRLHARLVWVQAQNLYVLQHCSKTNQTRVNDQVVVEQPLHPGDQIMMGKLVLELQAVPATPAAPPPAVAPEANGQAAAPPPANSTQTAWLGKPAQSLSLTPNEYSVPLGGTLPPDLEGWGLGQFVLGKELGRGSVGRVYLAHHESLNLHRAIKILAPEATTDPDFVHRFQSEARIAASLRHPNIIQVLDICLTDGLCYLVMEYIGSRSLLGFLEEAKGPRPVAWVVHIIDQLLSALAYAHSKGVVHRDIKPANILIDESRKTIALTDFSIAKVKDSMRQTSIGIVLGTLEYMAPELFDGHPAEPRVDLYAVGVMMYEMLTGIRPFRGKTNSEIIKAQLLNTPEPMHKYNPQITPELEAIVFKTLSKKADDRFPTAQAMREAIHRVFYRSPSTSPQAG